MHNNTNTHNHNGRTNQHHYYNNFPPLTPSISPRISFSNDFVESQGGSGRGAALRQDPRVPYCQEAAAGSSDFEFSVSNHNMMSADELFFKGRILPSFRGSKTTLREELLVEEEREEEEGLERRPTRGSGGGSSPAGRWKGLLGLRKGWKKSDSNKCEGSGGRDFDNNSSSQEMLNEEIVNKFK